jgi:hypothetical protein
MAKAKRIVSDSLNLANTLAANPESTDQFCILCGNDASSMLFGSTSDVVCFESICLRVQSEELRISGSTLGLLTAAWT